MQARLPSSSQSAQPASSASPTTGSDATPSFNRRKAQRACLRSARSPASRSALAWRDTLGCPSPSSSLSSPIASSSALASANSRRRTGSLSRRYSSQRRWLGAGAAVSTAADVCRDAHTCNSDAGALARMDGPGSSRNEDGLAVVAQLLDRLADVVERAVGVVLAGPRLEGLGAPAAHQLLDRRDVVDAVVQEAIDARHVAGEEEAI